jgi:hypothetical protein
MTADPSASGRKKLRPERRDDSFVLRGGRTETNFGEGGLARQRYSKQTDNLCEFLKPNFGIQVKNFRFQISDLKRQIEI